ncbi:MAG: bifunctional ornithine acetyltransferase/N-acetylglutamate synthase [Lachnospirales bacterium]
MKIINGGLVAPKGFKAGGIHCGIRKNATKKDLAVILSEKVGVAAAVYTKNLVKGAPILVTKSNLKDGYAQGVIVNSGNANTCNDNGVEIAEEMCKLFGEKYNILKENVIIASTGVIGEKLNIEPIKKGLQEIEIRNDFSGSNDASCAIMTTDLVNKEFAIEFYINEVLCKIGVIAKGSGMIHPNMATMLGFITTDVNISCKMLEEALTLSVEDTYNMLSVDGDTSTNDMVSIIANGLSGNKIIDEKDENFYEFLKALKFVNEKIVLRMAKDGEGATKLLLVNVDGAIDTHTAKVIAKSVCCSSLVKTAIFGTDANWGRILCAMGYSGVDFNVDNVKVELVSAVGKVLVCEKGRGVTFSEEKALKVLQEDEITIDITLYEGDGKARAYGCDLTYEYVKINGEYRS